MSQPALIKRILKEISLDEENVKLHDKPSNCSLVKSEDDPSQSQKWNYRRVIGTMIFLALSTRPDIFLFSVHQCAKFNTCPKQSHQERLMQIRRYMKRTHDRVIIMKP